VNLEEKYSFKFPGQDSYPFLATLEIEYQEVIWSNEYERHENIIREDFEGYLEVAQDHLQALINDLNSEDDSILNYLPFDENLDYEEQVTVNEYTGEKIIKRNLKPSTSAKASATKIVETMINELNDVVKNPEKFLATYFWEIQLDEDHADFNEKFLLGYLEDMPKYQEVIDRFHVFYGRDPENERIRAAHLAQWDEAQELARNGDSSKLEELQKLSPAAEAAVKEGKRITSQDGDCYVCGKFIPHFGGELILWNEIPKDYFNKVLEGNYKKWRVRHFSEACSQDQYGKRIHLEHLKNHTGTRNERADKCWLCEVEVDAGAGWLVNAEQIPKWKHAKKAFPKARPKKYCVQCGGQIEDV
jgi:hypothetical protein